MLKLRAVARLLLRAIPRGTVVRVMSGPARGAKWVVGAGSHGCWLGTYERQTQATLARLIHPGAVVYDIGANVGLFSVLAARLGATVHSFEPEPTNYEALERHIALNRFSEVTVHCVAVSDRNGLARFEGRGATGRLSSSGIEVRTIALDTLDAPSPTVMKIDVEGGELSVLRGARRLLSHARPTIVFEPHGVFLNGEDVDQECLRLLRVHDYACTRQARGAFVCVPQ